MPDGLTPPNFLRSYAAKGAPRRGEKSLAEMLSISDWRRFVPESIGLLGLVWLVRDIAVDTPAAYGAPHPFWIAILLISSQYGVIGGLFATSMASAAFFATELPFQSAGQDFYAYAATAATQPCAWFGIALIIGGLRTLHKHHEAELQDELSQARVTAGDLAEGLAQATAEIERVERRIAVDADTLASFSHALANLSLASREALVAGVGDILERVVGVTSFTIYLDGDVGLAPILNVEDGARVPPSALPLTTDGLRKASLGQDRVRMPYWRPIRSSGDGAPLGFLLCSRLTPSHDPDAAARRISDICLLLALLLPACPEPVA